MSAPDALSRIILQNRPELAGQVHYVNGRPWCDGVNHTTACEPSSSCKPGRRHYFIKESDGVTVCQICAAVNLAAEVRRARQLGQVPSDHPDARKPVGWGEHPHDCDCGECP